MSSLSARVNSLFLSTLLLLVLIAAGCGGGTTPVSVSVPAPSSGTTVAAGASAVTLTAGVTNDSTNKGVTWALSPATGCGSIAATSATTATYTPPTEASLNAQCTATITATSVADTSKTSVIALTIKPVAVNLAAPASGTTVNAGATAVTLTATLTNDSANQGVTWSLSPASGCGTLASSSTTAAAYTPPAEASLNANCTATITATSAVNSTKTSAVALTIDAVSVSLPAGESNSPFVPAAGSGVTLTANISNDASGDGLTWSISGYSVPAVMARSRRALNASPQSPPTTCGTLSALTGASVTYTPPNALFAPCTSTITVAATANPNITQQFTVTAQGLVTPSVTATNKVYDGTTNEPLGNVTCTTTLVISNLTCAPAAATFSSANAGNSLTVTATGITLSGSEAKNYSLTSTTAATGATVSITQATPTLSSTCTGGAFNNTPYSCAGTATGVGGGAVTGSFTFSYTGTGSTTYGPSATAPTNEGTYNAVGTFTSTNTNYTSGGTANSALTITTAAPTLVATCTGGAFNNTPYSCTGTATGIGGGAVTGSFAFSYTGTGSTTYGPSATAPTAAGTYNAVGTFTSTNANYTTGGAASSALTITAASPTLSATCTGGVYNNTAYSCTGTSTGIGGGAVTGSFAFSYTGTGSTTYGPSATAPTNAGTYSAVGTFTSTNSNYASGGTASGTLTVTTATPTLSATCTGGAFNNTPYPCTGTATGVGGAAVTGSFAFSYTGTGSTTYGPSATAPTNAGTYSAVGTFTSTNTNYVSGGTAGGALTITTAAPTLSATCTGGAFNNTPYSCTGTATGVGGAAVTGSFVFSYTGTGSTTYGPSATAPTNAGTYNAVGTFTSTNANYATGGTASGALTITTAAPTLSATCTGGVFNNTPYSCTGTATGIGGGAVTGSFAFSYTGTGSTTYGPSATAPTAAGTYNAVGTFTSTNSNYATGGTASSALTITTAAPTLSATCTGGAFNNTPYSCTGTATGIGGGAVTGSFAFSYTGTGSTTYGPSATAPAAAGTYNAVGTFTSTNSNYASGGTASGALTITTAAPTLSATCTGGAFNNTPYSCTGTATGIGGAGVTGSFAFSYTGTGSTTYGPSATAPTNAGTYSAVGTFSSTNSNYASGGTASGALTITTAAPTLSATCTGGAFNNTPYSCTGTATGVGGAGVTGSFVFSYTGTGSTTYGPSATAPTNAGTYNAVGTFTSTNANYTTGGTASSALTITTAAPTLSATCTGGVFNNAPYSCTGTATGIGGAGVTGSFAFSYTGTGGTTYGPSATAPTNAGTYSAVGTFTSTNSNYTSGGTASSALVISQASVAPSITAAGKTYDGTTNEPVGNVTCSLTPVESNLTCSAGAASFGSPNAGSQTVTATGITLGGTAASNYTLSTNQASNTATIAQATPTTAINCGPFAFTGSAQSCSGNATGIGGASVSGTFVFNPVSETAAGSYPETWTFTSSNSNYTGASGSSTLIITTFFINTVSLPQGTAGSLYSQSLGVTGGTGPYSWTILSGTPPSWLTLGPTTGVLSGTPSVSQWGSWNFTVKVTDSGSNSATQAYTLVIVPTAVNITTTSPLSAGNQNLFYSTTLAATGGTGTYTWSSSNLPGWLTLNPSTGVLSGTPTTTGPNTFNVTVSDSYSPPDTASVQFSLQVNSAIAVTLSYTSQQFMDPGQMIQFTPTVTNDSGNKGVNLTLNPTTGCGSLTASTDASGTPVSYNSPATLSSPCLVTVTATSVTDPSKSASFMIGVNVALSLPSTFSLGSATAGQAFAGGSVNVSGGTSNYTWTVNGTTVPTNGTPVSPSNADSLTASSTGGNTLSIGGTPVSAETVDLNVSVQDATGAAAGPILYTVTVNPAGFTISGWVQLGTGSGEGGVTITLSQGGSTVQTTTTATTGCPNPGGSGCYSFTGVSNGSYTITPSITASNFPGATALFNPASTPVIVSGNNVPVPNIQASLGYDVTGTVTYPTFSTTGKTGTVYIGLESSDYSCNNAPCFGTSIPSSAFSPAGTAFTIKGVPPSNGTNYTLTAWMDDVGLGIQNGSDPFVSMSAPVTVPTDTLTGATAVGTVPLGDTTNGFNLMAGPGIQVVAPFSGGVVLMISPVIPSGCNPNQQVCIEMPPRYHVQWSTNSNFSTIAGQTTTTLPAMGGDQPYILSYLNSSLSGLTSGASLYFQIRGENGAGNKFTYWTVNGCSPSTSGTGVTQTCSSQTPVTLSAASPGSNPYTVQGDVNWSYGSSLATGPLYIGCFDQGVGIFGEGVSQSSLSSVFPGSYQYTLSVPEDAGCFMFAFIDNNNTGVISPGDASDTGAQGNSNNINVTGNMTGANGFNIYLPDTNTVASVTTSHSQQQGVSGSDGYSVNFDLRSGMKLPVAVELSSESNVNVLEPMDLAPNQANKDGGRFQFYSNTNDAPAVNDTYGFTVSYSDNSSETVTATVNTVLVNNGTTHNFATLTSPIGTVTGDTTPTFTWTAPSNPPLVNDVPTYTYQFWLSDSNGGQIWNIPSNSSNSNGFSSSITSLAWPTPSGTLSCSNNTWSGSYSDPDGDDNPPNVCRLTTGTQYQWTIVVQDSNGNTAEMQGSFTP